MYETVLHFVVLIYDGNLYMNEGSFFVCDIALKRYVSVVFSKEVVNFLSLGICVPLFKNINFPN